MRLKLKEIAKIVGVDDRHLSMAAGAIDYDGDGDTDLAVYKVEPWGGMWYIKDQAAFVWGNSASIPVPGDYDGDGDTDFAVYNDGTWYIKDQFVDNWGDALSYPLPAPDTNADGDPWQ